MTFTKEAILERLIAAYSGPGSTAEGSFAGDVLRACADAMAELYSMEIHGLELRAFVSTATGDWLTKVCADRGVDRKAGESDAELRERALQKLASQPASGNADHYALWCMEVADILRVRVLPLHRGAGTVDIVAVDTNGKCPAGSVLDQAQAIVDANRPIGADAKVLGAAEVELEVTARVKLAAEATLESVTAAFTEGFTAFCKENALRTETVSYAKVLNLLLDTEGVADVTGFTINGGYESLSLADTAVAVVGFVNLSEMAEATA